MSIDSGAKGKRAERDLANWLKLQGWPDAERAVVTGFAVQGRVKEDTGDIAGTPGITWQVKHYNGGLTYLEASRFLDQAVVQAAAAGNYLAVLVERRDMSASPASWWAWVTLGCLGHLIGAQHLNPFAAAYPVRMQLATLSPLLPRPVDTPALR